jgi:hypothetical protein
MNYEIYQVFAGLGEGLSKAIVSDLAAPRSPLVVFLATIPVYFHEVMQ